MATILKCKMCGGDIEVNQDMTVGTCLFCGSTMTLPRIDSDKKARLFNRANEYRLNNEFDKAYEAYRAIVDEDEQEAEAYWGMLLAEYGVEYVEDPKSKKRVPTCHRTHVQSIKNTSNYEFACKYADAESRFIYQDEADEIDSIQKKIISVSAKEEPYDIFICYKETEDETGERTKDSVIAFDIYEKLEKKGYRTFFSKVTLEDVLGQDYEPYIYSALRSARVLLLVTTSTDHAQAVWVKNEWMRYLSFMEEGEDKTIIPVYSGISPYELPSELVKFQSQDIDKVGALQDLVRGIGKILGKVDSGSHVNSLQLNELIEDKKKREEKEELLKRKITAGACIALLLATFLFSYLFSHSVFKNLHVEYTLKMFVSRWPGVAYVFLAVLGASLICSIISYLLIIKMDYYNKITCALSSIGLILHCVSIGLVCIRNFTPVLVIVPCVTNAIIQLYFVILQGKMKLKKQMYTYLATTVIAIIILFCSLMKGTIIESNGQDITADQVEIGSEYLCVRKNPNTGSSILSEVYMGQFFNILNTVGEGDSIWYEIRTNTSIVGYVPQSDVLFHQNYTSRIVDGLSEGELDEMITLLVELGAERYDEELINCLKGWVLELIRQEKREDALRLAEYLYQYNDDAFKSEIDAAMEEADRVAEEKKNQDKYNNAIRVFENGGIEDAKIALKHMHELSEIGFMDSKERFDVMAEHFYQQAVSAENEKDYEGAMKRYMYIMEYSYADSKARYEECKRINEEEKNALHQKYMAIHGTWKCYDLWGTLVQFTVDSNNNIRFRYKLGSNRDWSSYDGVTYDPDTGKVNGIEWVRDKYTASINGRSMTITGNSKDAATFFTGSYTKVSDELKGY